jgi:membrane protease subunit HflC
MVGLLIAGFLGLVMLGEFGLGPLLITHEGEQNLILRLREAQAPALGPGLSWRIPLVDDVRTFEARELYLNVEPLPIQTRDKERIVIDNYVLWRIQDPLLFFKSFSTGQGQAELQIDRVVRADVREVIGRRTMSEVVTSERREIMREITEASRKQLEPFGVHIVDVRINLTELPPATEENVYARMRAERERLARKYRAEGKEEARGIRAEAQREARVIVAEANERSEVLKGEGDAQAARIYADAYNTDPEFYAFVRSLEAYRKTIGRGTTLVLPPGHEFFRLFESIEAVDPRERARPAPKRPAPAPGRPAVPGAPGG